MVLDFASYSLHLSCFLLSFFGWSFSLGDTILNSRTLVVAHHSEDISWLKQLKREAVNTVYVLTSGEEECKQLISPMSKSVTKAENKMDSNQPEIVSQIMAVKQGLI